MDTSWGLWHGCCPHCKPFERKLGSFQSSFLLVCFDFVGSDIGLRAKTRTTSEGSGRLRPCVRRGQESCQLEPSLKCALVSLTYCFATLCGRKVWKHACFRLMCGSLGRLLGARFSRPHQVPSDLRRAARRRSGVSVRRVQVYRLRFNWAPESRVCWEAQDFDHDRHPPVWTV